MPVPTALEPGHPDQARKAGREALPACSHPPDDNSDGELAADAHALLDDLRQTLAQLREARRDDPFLNPIQQLALRVGRKIDRNELTLATIERLIQQLTVESFARRAQRLGRYLGERDSAERCQQQSEVIRALAVDLETGAPRPFEAFRREVERERFGIVITAHPTFSLAHELAEVLVEQAMGDEAADPWSERIAQREHRPDVPLDLDVEHTQSLHALLNLHAALRDLYELVLEVAEEVFPEDWSRLTPRLVTLASWVGYDLDGRADIPWPTTFAKRLRLQALQLDRYRSEAADLRAKVGEGPLADLLDLLDARLALAVKQAEDEIQVFEARPTETQGWRAQLAAASRAMHAGRASRLTSADRIIDLVERAIASADDVVHRRRLCVLRAEIKTHGLGLAHTHIRINARQLHNAIRKEIGMDHPPDDPSHRLSYLNAISTLTERVQPELINFGSLLAEKATARRVFMIIAQMVKYLDRDQPIRFLIAECECGFTLLTALYFARLFDVEDRLDISPLFETQVGLEQGARVVAEALGVDSYRTYVQRRGRLCIQTGYSDAGRFVGQTAAAYLIERLRLAVGQELARQGLAGVELVIFDTHGESIGRGGHPEGFADRLAYTDTPYVRRAFGELGLTYKQEVSFQGGDGYLFFISPEAARTALTRVIEHAIRTPREDPADPFYVEADYVQEFYMSVQRFNHRIIDDPSYGALLGAFGTNMLHRTGSRPVHRQHDSLSGRISLEHPSQTRAIPHNAILQQLGFLANCIGGVGQAVAKDPERFQRLYEASPRFRRLMSMVEHAFKFSDLAVLKAYLDLFDPGLALMRAAKRGRDQRAEDLQTLAGQMERLALHERLLRIWRVFTRDYLELADALREHRRRTRNAGVEPIAVDRASSDTMHLLHAVRLVLIQRIHLLAIHVPAFSDRHEISHAGLVTQLFQLDVPAALARLEQIFPVTDAVGVDDDFGEIATYRSLENQSYAQEHALIFQPMAELHRLVRRVSAALTHNIGALG